MLGFEGVLGDWLDRITDDRGGLLIDLDRLEFPWGSAHLRTSGRIRIERIETPRPPVPRRATHKRRHG
ncbi:MAG: hypothetical protein HY558_06600 [Euryarchaeota archaeon]|nr:hypothetical protein [Euryarchaeota archaeon]